METLNTMSSAVVAVFPLFHAVSTSNIKAFNLLIVFNETSLMFYFNYPIQILWAHMSVLYLPSQ